MKTAPGREAMVDILSQNKLSVRSFWDEPSSRVHGT